MGGATPGKAGNAGQSRRQADAGLGAGAGPGAAVSAGAKRARGGRKEINKMELQLASRN